MKVFNKNNIYTIMDSDKVSIGDKGYFGTDLLEIQRMVEGHYDEEYVVKGVIKEVRSTPTDGYCFVNDINNEDYPIFYKEETVNTKRFNSANFYCAGNSKFACVGRKGFFADSVEKIIEEIGYDVHNGYAAYCGELSEMGEGAEYNFKDEDGECWRYFYEFDWDNQDHYRSFNADEMDSLKGKWVRNKIDGCEHMITSVCKRQDEEAVALMGTWVDTPELLTDYVFTDGTTCGVIKED